MKLKLLRNVNGFVVVINKKSPVTKLADMIDSHPDYNVTEIRIQFGQEGDARIIFCPRNKKADNKIKLYKWFTSDDFCRVLGEKIEIYV